MRSDNSDNSDNGGNGNSACNVIATRLKLCLLGLYIYICLYVGNISSDCCSPFCESLLPTNMMEWDRGLFRCSLEI